MIGEKREQEEHFNRAVIIDENFLGAEVDEFSLHGFSEKGQNEGAAMLGGDAFTEIYFKTKSGNIYKIAKIGGTKAMPEIAGGGEWSIIDGRSNSRKKQIKISHLSEEDLQKGILKIGEPFEYGAGGKTTEIAEIICVNGRRAYFDKQGLESMTEGRKNEVRKEFNDLLGQKGSK